MTWPAGGAVGELGALADLITPMAVRVAATLRLADLVAEGVTGTGELAERAGAEPRTLSRLMRHLSTRGVFVETEPDVFGMTELAECLRDDHPTGMRRWLELSGALGRAELGITHLLHSVRTGEAAYPRFHGNEFWADIEQDPHLKQTFDAVMASRRDTGPNRLFMERDWSAARSVVDVGGGQGATLVRLLSAYPELHGTLVELPETAAAGERVLADAGLTDRSTVIAGSFFDPLPPDADAYLLAGILHNWNDESAVRILRRCAEAVPAGGVVLIGGILVERGSATLGVATHLDLRMLNFFGASERTIEHLGELTGAAGLVIDSVHRESAGLAVVTCVRDGRDGR